MILKKCSCGMTLTVANSKYIGCQFETLALFNCPSCNSTQCIDHALYEKIKERYKKYRKTIIKSMHTEGR